MTKIEFEFSNDATPSLIKSSFTHPLLTKTHIAQRGRSAGSLFNCGTFQWTVAVQAICVLILKKACSLRASIKELHKPVEAVYIEGGKGSLAASLDYCLAKRPLWLFDMFGSDLTGTPIIIRLLRIVNSGSKRSGPVVIGIAPQTSQNLQVVIIQNKAEVLCPRRLALMAQSIENQSSTILLNDTNSNRHVSVSGCSQLLLPTS